MTTTSFDRAGVLEGQMRWLEELTSGSSEIAVRSMAWSGWCKVETEVYGAVEAGVRASHLAGISASTLNCENNRIIPRGRRRRVLKLEEEEGTINEIRTPEEFWTIQLKLGLEIDDGAPDRGIADGLAAGRVMTVRLTSKTTTALVVNPGLRIGLVCTLRAGRSSSHCNELAVRETDAVAITGAARAER
ncbi:hypothetical protein BJV78DRAFT_1155334 [Lactifluus subvellereus]|nr:hypothetical protein BJV78DRAFT_1155334 [Lactifluus subvellereus]